MGNKRSLDIQIIIRKKSRAGNTVYKYQFIAEGRLIIINSAHDIQKCRFFNISESSQHFSVLQDLNRSYPFSVLCSHQCFIGKDLSGDSTDDGLEMICQQILIQDLNHRIKLSGLLLGKCFDILSSDLALADNISEASAVDHGICRKILYSFSGFKFGKLINGR